MFKALCGRRCSRGVMLEAFWYRRYVGSVLLEVYVGGILT